MIDSLAIELLEKIVRKIKDKVEADPDFFNKSDLAKQSEKSVYKAIEEIIMDEGYDVEELLYDEKSHQFPDIVIKFKGGRSLGVEVKSSSSKSTGWSINGNSVLGTTSVAVDEIYLVFIKYNEYIGFDIRFASYEDCISDVVVTHSPRYRIDLDVSKEDNFFNKSGIKYKDLTSSVNPISIITEHFKSEGKTAWWLGDSSEDASSSATVLSWNDLKNDEIKKIYGQAFVLFPEIFNPSFKNKYSRFAKWLAVRYSVADSSLRDRFSAGGKFKIDKFGIVINDAPQVFKVLTDNVNNINLSFEQTELKELQYSWDGYFPIEDGTEARKYHWYLELKKNGVSDEILFYIQNLFKINIP